MEDYPHSLRELEARFSTQESCVAYLAALRWPGGFSCPRCAGARYWRTRATFECAACSYQASVTAGTIFQDTRLPLPVWFRAIWWVTTQKNGASALGLKRVLGISYKTAWTCLHKLRRAMVRPEREPLSGRVEVDESYVGGLEEEVCGRETEKKALIVVAAEEDGKGIGRIRMQVIPNASSDSLSEFVIGNVKQGSTVHTDGWLGYDDLDRKGYVHEVTVLRRSNKKAHECLPRVHLVVSLLKRWLLGTHQGAVGLAHLDYYLDEFTFRFNRRKSRSRGKLFYRLMQNAVIVDPVPYARITKRSKPFCLPGLTH